MFFRWAPRAILARSITACAVASVLPALAGAANWESFEDGIPDGWSTDSGKLAPSTLYARHGRHSLRWDWRAGEYLTVRHGLGDLERTGGYAGTYAKPTFGLWYYVEQPVPGTLRVEFLTEDRVSAHLETSLDQPGWNRLHAWLARDAKGTIDPMTDHIRFRAPASLGEGALFIDLVVYNGLLDYRRQYVPTVAPFHSLREDTGLLAAIGSVGPDAVAEVQTVRARVERFLLGSIESRPWPQVKADVDAAVHFDASGVLRGDAVVHDRNLTFYDGIDGITPCSALTRLLRETAVHWHLDATPAGREVAAERFTRIVRYLRNQGMRAQSGFDWSWYEGRDLVEACVLGGDILAQQGLRDWALDYVDFNYRLRNALDETPEPVDMDYFHLTAPSRLHGALLLPEPTMQAAYIAAYSKQLARNILHPGSDGLKPDGSAYHHGGQNVPYARYGLNNLARIVEGLSGTSFRLDADAHARVREALLSMRFYTNFRDAPLSLQGRHLFDAQASQLMDGGFWLMARAGPSGDRKQLDADMAGAYLRYRPDERIRDVFVQADIRPEPHPRGHRSFPYGCFAAHRRSNWLAVVKGQSRYVWGAEIYAGANRYGRYLGHGFLEILGGGEPVGLRGSGCIEPGWDWRRLDGTTVVDVPLEEVRPHRPGTEFVRSATSFVGGVSHRDWNGAFAMRLDPVGPHAQGLQANKSYFFFDDRVVCMGSSISSTNIRHAVVTTLFQKHLPTHDTPCEVDGKPFSGFPDQMLLSAGATHTVLDPQRTGYYVAESRQLRVTRGEQVSRDSADRHATRGPFATAWLEHGPAPRDAGYAYVVLVQTTPVRLAAFAAAMQSRSPPVILARRDGRMHVAWDRASRTWGIAFYAPTDLLSDGRAPDDEPLPTCPVIGATAPCLVMAEDRGTAGLVVSIADPDLRLQDHVSQPGHVTVTFHQRWQVVDSPSSALCRAEAGASSTRLTVPCRDGESVTVTLAPLDDAASE